MGAMEIINPISELVSIFAMILALVVMIMVFAVLIGQVISRLFEG
jgi:hypothetical protein